jgi:hypothetical protein
MTARPFILCFVLMAACRAEPNAGSNLAPVAERFFRAVYECVDADLAELASPEVRMSYPIFAERLGTSVLEGLDAVEGFSRGFCQRWSNPTVVVHEAIATDRRAVLVWSFSATSQIAESEDEGRASWGGITVFHFDDEGRVIAEFGEESTPGPVIRMNRSR